MRVFVTGATGYIGSAVVKDLIKSGHDVIGLARSKASAASLAAAGAQAHPGALDDLESLRTGAAGADGVIHLAFMHGFSQINLATRLRVLLGGLPSGIVGRFMAAGMQADRNAIQALGSALKRKGSPLVVAFPTMAMTAGRLATEDDSADPKSVGGPRAASEALTLSLVPRGVRASLVRIAPSVHGQRDPGLLSLLVGIARKKGESAYVGAGQNRWPAVHQQDAATLFRLALENGDAGARYHAVADEGVPFRSIAEHIGRRLNIPVVSKSPAQAASHFGWLGSFVSNDNPVSSKLTQARLGWQPTGPGLLADIQDGDYFAKR